MNKQDYEYRGLLARSWDFIRGDTSHFQDRAYYRELVGASGMPILIVGCGTGRLLLEYELEGFDVDGIDNSPEMLELCQQKAESLSLSASVSLQSMESMNLPRRYQTIIVPSSAFQLVPDPEESKRALAGFFTHLLPGGTLVMSIWQILDSGAEEWSDWWLVADKEGFEDDRQIRRWERSRYDANSRLRHTEGRYELLENGEIVCTEHHRRSPELRNYSPEQLSTMLRNAGFTNVMAVTGFSNEPASDDDELFCIRGIRR